MPENKDWFAYKTSEPESQAFLAEAVGRELGLDFAPADISLTAGAFGAIATAFRLLLDPGDEAIFSLPPWFCYESMLLAIDAVPRKVPLARPRFDLDLEAIEAAITERTRLVIVNSPNNPTGRIYDEDAAARARRAARARLGADRAAHLPAVGRALPADPLRRPRFRQPGDALSLDPDQLQLRQDHVGAGPAHRLPGLLPPDARGRAQPVAAWRVRRAGGDGLGLSQCLAAARPAGAGDFEHRHDGAGAEARPDAADLARSRLRGARPGRHFLSLRRLPGRRRGALPRPPGGRARSSSCRARCWRRRATSASA